MSKTKPSEKHGVKNTFCGRTVNVTSSLNHDLHAKKQSRANARPPRRGRRPRSATDATPDGNRFMTSRKTPGQNPKGREDHLGGDGNAKRKRLPKKRCGDAIDATPLLPRRIDPARAATPKGAAAQRHTMPRAVAPPSRFQPPPHRADPRIKHMMINILMLCGLATSVFLAWHSGFRQILSRAGVASRSAAPPRPTPRARRAPRRRRGAASLARVDGDGLSRVAGL